MNKQPNAFAVYPDSMRMGLADENELSAIFIHREHANAFSHKMWGEFKTITPIYSQNFDPDFKESEFTAGQEVEVSDDGVLWQNDIKFFYIGKKKNGRFLGEDDRGNLSSYGYCRPIKEKVTYYVYLNKETDTIYTHKEKPTHERFELIHSFTI